VTARLLFIICILPVLSLVAAGAEPSVAGIDPLEEARREFQSGQVDAALAALDRASKEEAGTARGLDLRGSIYLEQGKLEEAIKAFRAASEVEPTLSAPHLHLADAFLRQKNWQEARSSYETVNKGTNILILSERLRYGILLSCLGAKDEAAAQTALDRLVFPTETPAFYYAQAAWAFAHGNGNAAAKWIRTADGIFDAKKAAWFARPLYELGWIKTKPAPVLD
jgi:tetratricopeptide (TPR) repeat protein